MNREKYYSARQTIKNSMDSTVLVEIKEIQKDSFNNNIEYIRNVSKIISKKSKRG